MGRHRGGKGGMMIDERRDQEIDDDARFTTSLVALAFALFLAIVGLYLLNALRVESRLEDCVMAGRTNCEPIESPGS
jgi:hypothetical protein